MNKVFRKVHLKIAPILFVPLIITAFTGMLYGVLSRFDGLPFVVGEAVLKIHQGEFLGRKLVPFYVLLMGLGIFTIGLTTWIRSKDNLMSREAKPKTVSLFKLLALILVIPLAICVETGVAYQLGTDWLNLPEQQTSIFLSMHTGASMSTIIGIFYTLITGLSLVGLSIIGIKMTPLGKTVFPQSQTRSPSIATPATSEPNMPVLDNIVVLRRRIRQAIVIFSGVFIAILAFTTSELLLPIGIVAIVFTIPALVISEQLIQDWQYQKGVEAVEVNYNEEAEAESATILRAIPDSMLRMTQDGICLSYIPAKEASPFVITGEIINKHVNEFLAPEIARQFIKSAQVSLRSGLTHYYRFPIPLDNGGKKLHEARITAIGASEVLIMIREISGFDEAIFLPEEVDSPIDDDGINLLTEPELVQILELTIERIQQDDQHHILCCLVVDDLELDKNISSLEVNFTETQNIPVNDVVIEEVALKMKHYLSSDYIARLNENELVMLALNCSLDQASILVKELRQDLATFSFKWQGNDYSTKFRIGVLEINADSPKTNDLIDAAKAMFNMAKQKVDVKTFW